MITTLFGALAGVLALATAFVRWRNEVDRGRLRRLEERVASLEAERQSFQLREASLKAENQKLREEIRQRDLTIEELRRKIEELEERLNAMLQSGAKHS